MSRGYKPEQIISMLREAEVGLSQGKTVGQACRAFEPGICRYAVLSAILSVFGKGGCVPPQPTKSSDR